LELFVADAAFEEQARILVTLFTGAQP
jgi:hypothetical protein